MSGEAYADYGYYRDVYLGNAVSEGDFPRLALRASRYMDRYTRGRAASMRDTEQVKNACCALAERISTLERAEELARAALAETDGALPQRETVGAWSVSYRGGGDCAASARSVADGAEAALAAAARELLAGTGLCYRGGKRP